ncbi:MAG: hypothetical protein IT167_23120 [Bryobacterales bacterium]|nr:hypothetical protein [Bryobacterales bacterium]
MQFTGEQLESILRKQVGAVEVVDFSGRVRLSVSGAEVATRIILTGYVGVGNHSRIRYVKPEGVRYRPEEFASKRQVEADFRDAAEVPRDAQMNPVAKGAKTWHPQPARSKTGHGGSVVTVFVKR